MKVEYAYHFWKCADAVYQKNIKISPCLSKLQLAKVRVFLRHRVLQGCCVVVYVSQSLASVQWPPSATVVSAEPFSHGTGTLRCLQKEMATYRHWSVSLWWDPDDVSHCRILSPDKTEWWLISATLCGWRRCFVANQLWFMTRIREEEEDCQCDVLTVVSLSYTAMMLHFRK